MFPADLIIAVQSAPPPRPLLVCHRRVDGSSEAGFDRWPEPFPHPCVLLYWPSRFLWDAIPADFPERILEGDGLVLPLAAVLQRLEVESTPRTFEDLLGALGLDFGEIEEPEFLGGLLVKVLAERMEGILDLSALARSLPMPRPKFPPRPEVGGMVAVLPETPGVYTFLTYEDRALYVGKARSLKDRIRQYFGPRPVEEDKSARLAREATALQWTGTGSELEALLIEHRFIRRDRPLMNLQRAVQERERGEWRAACVLLVLPSSEEGSVEVCLVAGDGRFHWERIPRKSHVPGGLWRRLGSFLQGDSGGWAPGESGCTLQPQEARALAEITLSWMVEKGEDVNRIDLTREAHDRSLAERLRQLLGEDPAGGRIEVV